MVTDPSRHEMPVGSTRAPRSQRSTSEASSTPASGGTMPHSLGQPRSVNAQAMSHGSGVMAINSIIEYPIGNELSYSAQGMGEFQAHSGIGPTPLGYPHEWTYGPMRPGDSPIYSSDSCSSPMSDYPNPQIPYQSFQSQEGIQRPPSTFSDAGFHPRTIASPLSAGPVFSPTWGTFDPAPTYGGVYVPTVGNLVTMAGLSSVARLIMT